MEKVTFPSGKSRIAKWEPYIIEGDTRALILSDIHIPYHRKRPITMAIKYGKYRRVDTIILNGDILDCYAISKWETDPRERNFPEELEVLEKFFRYLRSEFPHAKIVYKLGNHEERWESYMIRKSPELIGVKEFQIENLLKLKEHRIDLVIDKAPIVLGDLNVLHGHEYRFAISNPVNPARGLFLRTKANAMCGHFHQSSYHTAKSVNEKIIATWSTGCLCDLHPKYLPINDWVHGFAVVDVRSGKFSVENKVVREGKIY